MKFIFKCLLNSGMVLEQTTDDKSQTTPNKNAFYDVLQNMSEIRAFALYNQETGEEWLLDLLDQHLEHNIPKINVYSVFRLNRYDEKLDNVRLIYYKTNFFDFINREKTSVIYTLGFQGNLLNGENKQYTLTLY